MVITNITTERENISFTFMGFTKEVLIKNEENQNIAL
jgi:hypothetical protein